MSQTLLLGLMAALAAPLASAQVSPADSLSAGFNSSFELSQSQIERANISERQVASINNIMQAERSQLANGGPAEDDFYTLPPDPVDEPGKLLKVQAFTDTAPFTLAPNTALSRIMYTTSDYNGTVVPATAFVLWPFTPRTFDASPESSAAPVVLWTHGTSGFFAPAAPSTHRALWYGHEAPFTLALDGYAVVAPDYAGLGISKSWDGSNIPHQYLASPVSAKDALNAMRAARDAFPELLSEEYVVMGHSQGGGVAWGVAEALADEDGDFSDLIEGYRGTIAGSPTTDTFTGLPQFILSFVGMILDSIFPEFKLSDWLTPLGLARVEVFKEIEATFTVGQQLLLNEDEKVIVDDWEESPYVEAYGKLANAGSKNFRGPLLVIQGTVDMYVPYNVTSTTVQETCKLYPTNDLEYIIVNGTGHVPALDATRRTWMKWIEDRFEGKPVKRGGCVETTVEGFLPMERYLTAGNSFLQWAGAPELSYLTPLGP